MKNEQTLIAEYMRRLCDHGLTTCLGGNISIRSNHGLFITPSNLDKYTLNENDIIELDVDGETIKGLHKPSMEYMMHVNVYKTRPDMNAIIHAHPFYSTLFSTLGEEMEINIRLTVETLKNVGTVGISEYAPMGTMELANVVADTIRGHNVVLMQNHGVLTVGKSILEAYYRLEILEQAAKMTYHSRGLAAKELTSHEVERYLRLNGKSKLA